MKEFEITISPEGEIKFESSGYSGGACLKIFEAYLAHMKAGGVETEIKDQKKKPEFYKVSTGAQIKTGSN